jgi:hypothetical protein
VHTKSEQKYKIKWAVRLMVYKCLCSICWCISPISHVCVCMCERVCVKCKITLFIFHWKIERLVWI